MQSTLSLILNVVLLVGVVFAIVRILKARRQGNQIVKEQPSLGVSEPVYDDIISVRKIDPSEVIEKPVLSSKPAIKKRTSPRATSSIPLPTLKQAAKNSAPVENIRESTNSVMMFLLAKENRQLAGYELLQSVLAAGLRFGEGQLFHRHQFPNGQGPILCSLAAATASGIFDLQNIGAFSVHGLCLFMQASGNPTIDADRFNIMLDTAKQLSEGLDTYLLDEQRRPLSEESIQRYYRQLNLELYEAELA